MDILYLDVFTSYAFIKLPWLWLFKQKLTNYKQTWWYLMLMMYHFLERKQRHHVMWVCHVCWNEGMQLFKCKSQSTSSHFTQIRIKKPLCHAFLSTRNWIEFSQFNYTWRTRFFGYFVYRKFEFQCFKLWNNAYKKAVIVKEKMKQSRSFLEILPMKTKVKHLNRIFKRIHSFVRSNIIVNFFFVRSNEKFQFAHIKSK